MYTTLFMEGLIVFQGKASGYTRYVWGKAGSSLGMGNASVRICLYGCDGTWMWVTVKIDRWSYMVVI